ncbi:MAG: NPCBM/NEW2 domain-containing protein [Verrucomicrobia bacterium]|nr:NPCBM/NEW2 domain-containing protein [Verrucomicrobiota bacterium]
MKLPDNPGHATTGIAVGSKFLPNILTVILLWLGVADQALVLTVQAAQQPIGLVSPEDGGFPREASRLVRVAANDYRIDLPSAEDCHIMVEATNPSPEIAWLTLDLNPNPTARKEHFYYRTPRGRWFRKHLESDQPRLVVPAEPGTTRVAGVPWFTYAEDIIPVAGTAAKKANAHGGPMVIYPKTYDHGLGMRAGQSVTFAIPAGANSFKANVAMDDSESNGEAALQFVVKIDGKEAWRSSSVQKFDSQIAHVALPGSGSLTLAVDGPTGVLANWGGARFSLNDPDKVPVGPAPEK